MARKPAPKKVTSPAASPRYGNIWEHVRTILQRTTDAFDYSSCFKRTTLLEEHPHLIVVETGGAYDASYIALRLADEVRNALHEVGRPDLTVRFRADLSLGKRLDFVDRDVAPVAGE